MHGRCRVSEGSSRFRTSAACITVMNALQRNAMPANAFLANDTTFEPPSDTRTMTRYSSRSMPVARLSAVAALFISVIPVFAQRAVAHEKDIVRAIVDQFDKSDLVGLGELHGSQADQDLRFQVIHSKAFARKVRIIAVEGLNAFYQEDLDRYIRGQNVPLEQVQKVWRDSTG